LIKLYPGQGFENVKWRYDITFKPEHELEDMLVNYELENTLTQLIEELQSIKSKNLTAGENKSIFLNFIKNLTREKERIKWYFKDSNEYLRETYERVDQIPYGKFNIDRLINEKIKEKNAKYHKSYSSGNIGYLWVSDPRVFEYAHIKSPFKNFNEYLSYLYTNDFETYRGFEEAYFELLKSYSKEEAIEYLQSEFEKHGKFYNKSFYYEYNGYQSHKFEDTIPGENGRCGLVLSCGFACGYVEFTKAAINLTLKNNKKYLIAPNPEINMGVFEDKEFRKNLTEKIGIFDVDIQIREQEIVLTEKTVGKYGLIFFNAIYSQGVRVKDSKGNIHIVKFVFDNLLQ
jgi:hypothetical protein